MSLTSVRGSMEWALMVALILGGGAIAQAQNGQAADDAGQQPQGKIVRIGPAGDSNVTIAGDPDDGQIQLDGPPQLELPIPPLSADLKTMWPRPAVGALVPIRGAAAMMMTLSALNASQVGSMRS